MKGEAGGLYALWMGHGVCWAWRGAWGDVVEQGREMMGRGCGGVRVEVCVRGVGDMGRRDETRRGQQVYDSDRSSEK